MAKDGNAYFVTADLKQIVASPFEKVKLEDKYEISVMVKGGWHPWPS